MNKTVHASPQGTSRAIFLPPCCHRKLFYYTVVRKSNYRCFGWYLLGMQSVGEQTSESNKERDGIATMDDRPRSNCWCYPQMTLEAPQTALLIMNMAPVPVNVAMYAINQPIVQNKGFHQTEAAFSLPGAAGNRQAVYHPLNMANSA